ncbi:hypothetical protein MN116_005847 [Schistosoma mekongi]|uniref:GMP phosphodiesterase delta subunit domain-containing protein n=1 Tax=Schistosoma mekongi TaxID=38744 RepID=A0AAE2D3S8_SCHME|nr:hypothetical protein MN116_005847 [Schistosoma mekongi]
MSRGGVTQQYERAGTSNPKSTFKLEEELISQESITIDDVLQLRTATIGFLCPPNCNVYDIKFLRFALRNLDTHDIIFEVERPPSELLSENREQSRCIRYQFSPDFLNLKTIGATIEFSVGDRYLSDFRMVERHYFKDILLKSFDLNFGFVLPYSVNTVEHIYEFPELSDAEVDNMVRNPFDTRSDSFYFVDGILIMHNKAEYAFNG